MHHIVPKDSFNGPAVESELGAVPRARRDTSALRARGSSCFPPGRKKNGYSGQKHLS